MSSQEPRQGWVEANGLRLHYWDWPGGEPALLCMHGISVNGRYFDTLAERLSGRRRVVALDLRGRGLSDKPPAGSYGWEQHASDMAAVVLSLDMGPTIAVGHSLGGCIATLLAAMEPEGISGLVVLDAATDIDEANIRVQVAASLKRLATVFPSLDAYFAYWRQVPFITWTPAFERFLLADAEERADGTVVCRTLPAGVEEDLLYYFRRGTAAWFADMARRVRAPTVVCWAPGGLVDPQPLMSRQGIERLAQLIPHARVLPIEGTNHYTILMIPEAVDQIIQAIDGLGVDSVDVAVATAGPAGRE